MMDWLLENLNYDMILSKDGDEAIEMYKMSMESGRPINNVIMNLTIPGAWGKGRN